MRFVKIGQVETFGKDEGEEEIESITRWKPHGRRTGKDPE